MSRILATSQTEKRYRLRMRPLYRIHQCRNERRDRYAGSRLQNFTALPVILCCIAANLLSKLLRSENLRAFSILDLVGFLQSKHEAFTLLYSMAKELHHSH